MPLPQQVIEQLGNPPEANRSPVSGALLFSIGMLAIVAVLYCGITFAYEPYLNAQVMGIKDQVSKANASISADQETRLIDFYSQISNLQSLLSHHVYTSGFLSWLENNTEGNVYYQSLDLTAGDRVTLKGVARTEADVNQQLAVFESSPDVASAVVTSIAPASSAGGNVSGLAFSVTLTMKPSVFTATTTLP